MSTWYMYIIINIMIIIVMHLTPMPFFFSTLVFITNTKTVSVISVFCNNSAEGYHSMDRITQAVHRQMSAVYYNSIG